MDNNINLNFKGSFLINYKKALPGVREGFEKAVGKKHVQIFDSFEGNQDSVLYVMKNSKDFAAANFVKLNEMNFEYIPEMDTRLRFDEYFPDEVSTYLTENKPKVIKKISELMDYISENRIRCRERKNSHIGKYQKILNTMGVDVKGEKHTNSFGVTNVEDVLTGKTAIISPASKLGTRFIAIKHPKKLKKHADYYAVDENGNILKKFKFPDDILLFRELFNKTIKTHLNLD